MNCRMVQDLGARKILAGRSALPSSARTSIVRSCFESSLVSPLQWDFVRISIAASSALPICVSTSPQVSLAKQIAQHQTTPVKAPRKPFDLDAVTLKNMRSPSLNLRWMTSCTSILILTKGNWRWIDCPWEMQSECLKAQRDWSSLPRKMLRRFLFHDVGADLIEAGLDRSQEGFAVPAPFK